MGEERKGRRFVRRRAAGRTARGGQRALGYAVIGLGHIAQEAVLPGFDHARSSSRLMAIVSGEATKRDKLAKKYEVRAYDYDDFEECLASEDVDAVYIALPNDMHAEYVERAARAGVHVLCEKPLGLSSQECLRMIRACEDAGVQLMTAYRLHFEPANLEAINLATSGKLGDLRFFSSNFSFEVQAPNIRVEPERGGGPLWDIGTYCVNAARNLFRAEPERVFAVGTSGHDQRFRGVEESVSAILEFSDERLATFNVSFNASATATFQLVGTHGDVRLDGAYEYEGERILTQTLREKRRTRTFAALDQFGPELVYFSECVLKGREVEPSGWEGLADVRVIEALHESIRTGKRSALPAFEKRRRPTRAQVLRRPPVRKPKLVEAGPPFH